MNRGKRSPLASWLIIPVIISFLFSCKGRQTSVVDNTDETMNVDTLIVLPENPGPGEPFRILAIGSRDLRKAGISVTGSSASIEPVKTKNGEEYPYWLLADFPGVSDGEYKVILTGGRSELGKTGFSISGRIKRSPAGTVWKSRRGWDRGTELFYSAWINSLFHGCNEQSSWTSLHEVTQNREQNLLFNYLSLGEDDPDGKNSVVMQPDCADNPFFLRAYFAWKLGLPFGYHVCDRGYLGKNPGTGQWITNESSASRADQVQAFNIFLRRIMDGVHSGTARTSLDNENSDYYPVSLDRASLRPGTVFADPYGHTLILVSRVEQTSNRPGLLLAVDAQPDGTVAIKRFWKGNFLFNTSEVVGEPGFKAFRPINLVKGALHPVSNEELTAASGFIPFSLQQRKMESDVFYHTMERLINPKPLDPEEALLDLIQALHEQLLVRVNSVSNGEAYFKSHPGAIIPMPTGANGIFLAGGQWENFSTPNRDLRLLIAMDAVIDFPDHVAASPDDYKISSSPGAISKRLNEILEKKGSELSITYTRSDGSLQKLTVGEILKRRDAFEMAYNPNDGAEIRWGAPENSDERSTCHRQAPSNQRQTMQSVRKWFNKRLHPPT